MPLYGPVPVLESKACTVKLNEPPAVVVPLRTPVAWLSARPAGKPPPVHRPAVSVPFWMAKVWPPVPPLAVSVCV